MLRETATREAVRLVVRRLSPPPFGSESLTLKPQPTWQQHIMSAFLRELPPMSWVAVSMLAFAQPAVHRRYAHEYVNCLRGLSNATLAACGSRMMCAIPVQ